MYCNTISLSLFTRIVFHRLDSKNASIFIKGTATVTRGRGRGGGRGRGRGGGQDKGEGWLQFTRGRGRDITQDITRDMKETS